MTRRANGRFGAREAFADCPAEVKPSAERKGPHGGFRRLINRCRQAFAVFAERAKKAAMADERITQALARIDAALDRIETASSNRPAIAAPDKPAMAALVARHENLRESVSGSLTELDALIERLER